MSKAYAIFHDTQRVLVGSGGFSGKKSLPRQGFHLPGGTVDHTAKNQTLNNDKVLETIWRELREEFGVKFGNQCNELLETNIAFKNFSLDGYKVYFVICEVGARALDACSGLIYDGSGCPFDTHFTQTQAVSIQDAMHSFRSNVNTNWFATGLNSI